MEGYLYVLFDAYSGRCKIGRTRQAGGKRQRSIMAAYPVPTINVLNARVADHVEAETQCHRYFANRRANGEWFDVGLVEVVEYVHQEIDWCELDFESLGAVTQYIARARLATSHSGIGKRHRKATNTSRSPCASTALRAANGPADSSKLARRSAALPAVSRRRMSSKPPTTKASIRTQSTLFEFLSDSSVTQATPVLQQ